MSSVWKKLIAAGLLVLVLGLVWVIYIQLRIESGIRAKANETSDTAIVLGAALWNNVPSPGLRERLDHALELYRSGLASRILVSGGLDGNGSTISEAEGMSNYLLEQGVPKSDILLENRSRSTYENLLFSKKIMEDHGLKSAVIVTHGYHGARALDIARFVDIPSPRLDTCGSRVLNLYWHRTRETLAFTKWKLQKLLPSTMKTEKDAQEVVHFFWAPAYTAYTYSTR